MLIDNFYKAMADYTGEDKEDIRDLMEWVISLFDTSDMDIDYIISLDLTNIEMEKDHVRYGVNGVALTQFMKDLEEEPMSEIEQIIINQCDYRDYSWDESSHYHEWLYETVSDRFGWMKNTISLWEEDKAKQKKYGEAKEWIDAYQDKVDTEYDGEESDCISKLVDFDDSGIPYLICKRDIYHYENGEVKKVDSITSDFFEYDIIMGVEYCKQYNLISVHRGSSFSTATEYYDSNNFKNIAGTEHVYSHRDEQYGRIYDEFYYVNSNTASEEEFEKVLRKVCNADSTGEVVVNWSIKYEYSLNYESSVEAAFDIYLEAKDAIGEEETRVLISDQHDETTQSSANNTTPNTSNTSSSGYILPESNTKYLTKSDLQGFTAEQCKIARNEIYARHGRKFTDETLQAYFDSCSWYKGTIEPDKFDDSVLNDYEKANRDLIVEYESEVGYR